MDPNTRRFLHVANGTSTTDTIHAAGIPGSTSIWADPLHEGPVPARLTDEELLDVRARHLAGDDRSGIALAETIAELRRWRDVIDDQASYDELVLWYEHDLFDQLNLIQLLDAHRTKGGFRPQACQPHLHRPVSGPSALQGTRRALGARARIAPRDTPISRRQPVRACGASVGGVPRGRSAGARPLARYRHVRDAVSRVLAAASPRGVSVDARRAVANRASDHAARAPRVDRHPEGVSADARRRVGVLHCGLVVLADRDRNWRQRHLRWSRLPRQRRRQADCRAARLR